MGSKGILFLCISLAVTLMIASEVAASRDLAETSTSVETSKEVESTDGRGGYNGPVDGYHGGGGYGGGYGGGGHRGGGHGGYRGGGGRGGHPQDAKDHHGGSCSYGCCWKYNYGGCKKCCSYAGEAAEP